MSSPVGLMGTVLVIRSRGGPEDRDQLRDLMVGGGAYYRDLLQATQSGETFPPSHNVEPTPAL